MPRPSAADRAMAERIAADLGSVGFALPGTILERLVRCGTMGCRCHADPPQLHGPYYQWTRKVAGKTETRLLSVVVETGGTYTAGQTVVDHLGIDGRAQNVHVVMEASRERFLRLLHETLADRAGTPRPA